jgi:hypothetical protein
MEGFAVMKSKSPLGVMLLGGFYILGAIVILLALVLGTKQAVLMNIRFGVPFISDTAVTICIAVVSVIVAYGYMRTLKWGYWSMIVYSAVFFVISSVLAYSYHSQPFAGNAAFSLIVLIYTFCKRRYFYLKPAAAI